jgi:hypothetical protein
VVQPKPVQMHSMADPVLRQTGERPDRRSEQIKRSELKFNTLVERMRATDPTRDRFYEAPLRPKSFLGITDSVSPGNDVPMKIYLKVICTLIGFNSTKSNITKY